MVIEFTNEKKLGFEKRVTVTSALPYVNGVKHLGNIVGSILPADVFHRFLDLFEIDNIFVCGTDDHGTTTEVAALKEKLSPKEYADKYYKIQKDIYEKWNFDFTWFGRTSSKTNHKTTQELFLAIYKNGFILEQKIVCLFCKKCKRFLPDRYIFGTCPKCGYENARGDQCESCGTVLDPADLVKPRCSICKGENMEFKEEKHLFLDLSKLQNDLKKWIIENDHWPSNTRNLALGWIKEGLKPRCITRNLEWGIKVPLKGYEDLVFYVWLDAPIGYISITKDAQGQGLIKNWKEWWTKDAQIYHFLGKDNIPFHTIFWPGMIIAGRNGTNYSLPYYVAGYEYLNWEGKKFSTSKGIGLFSDEALNVFPADYWRFYLCTILPENKDSNFSWDDFQKTINNELIANYGNLFYRVTSFIDKNFGGSVPKPGKPGEGEKALEKELEKTIKDVEKLVRGVKLKEALERIMELSGKCNKYFQSKEPWDKIKSNKKSDKEDVATTLYTTVNLVRAVSQLLYPYIPATSEKALKALNIKNVEWKDAVKFVIKHGHKIKPLILFKKVENDDVKKYFKK